MPFHCDLKPLESVGVRTYQRIMLVIRWLRHKNLLGVEGRFDEMMGPNICHNLGSGIDLRVKLLLEAGKKIVNKCIDSDGILQSRTYW